ncbi:MAG: hypothetical protein AAGH92_12985 [Planctomycetota bacterium]
MNDPAAAGGAVPCVVVLGASNVRRGFPQLVDAVRGLCGGPIAIHAAMGHGRSYGNWSSIPGRSLPAITECGLWRALDAGEGPIVALVTDVGNDLLYGVEPEPLVGWVDHCVERLRAKRASVVVTELPVANLRTLGEWRFRFFRTLFFPACRLSLAEMADRAHRVNEGLRHVAESRSVALAPLPSTWYGFDPIHLKPSIYEEAWKKLLGLVTTNTAQESSRRLSLAEALSLRVALPEQRRLLGFDQQRTQPIQSLRDGTKVSLY